MEELTEALEELEIEAEEWEVLKRTGGSLEKLAVLEEGLLEKALAIKYLLHKCNSVLEGEFEMVDLLKQ
ncbi:MAG TPA: hypothetical protein VHS59_07120 [Bacillota bacterium]|nr:hypothetical protein [Bacillota bacterium]